MVLSKAFYRFLNLIFILFATTGFAQTVVRYNQLGYTPHDIKMVVAASSDPLFRLAHYQVKNIKTGQVVLKVMNAREKDFGIYGPFKHSYRVNLSSLTQPGIYRLVVNDSITSGPIKIDNRVYKGRADQCLRFIRDHRCGFNPIKNDSCHQGRDFTIGGPLPDSSVIDVSGGWHSAGNGMQLVTTAAATTWYLLSAFQHFPVQFNDSHLSNGIPGKNEEPDVLDEAKWGLDWLIKMHPAKDHMYRQVGDSARYYLPQPGRPVYFVRAKGQQGLHGTVRTAGLLSSAFSLGSTLMGKAEFNYANRLMERAENAYHWAYDTDRGLKEFSDSGLNAVTLAAGQLYSLNNEHKYLADLNVINHNNQGAHAWAWQPNDDLFLLMSQSAGNLATTGNINLTKTGMDSVLALARKNAFFRGLPFSRGSNKLTVAFANLCGNYRISLKDSSFAELEQANIDWLFGCNPWGVTMVSGFRGMGSVKEPYSLKSPGIKTGLVGGPVTPSIYQSSPGTSLLKEDEYASWQSDLAVYHDDKADYVTNEPTIDGTAALVYLLASRENEAFLRAPNGIDIVEGAIVRGDSSRKKIAIVFLGNQYTHGIKSINQILGKEKIRASFFLTSRFIKSSPTIVRQLKAGGHYIGPNGFEHISNCDIPGCDTLMAKNIAYGIMENYNSLKPYGISLHTAPIFLPNSHKYNETLSEWAAGVNLTLINPTPGTLSLHDKSLPGEAAYAGSDMIFQSIMDKAHQMPYGLNGYILAFHADADQGRTDKFYMLLPLLLQDLKNEGYQFVRADELIGLKAPVVKKQAVKKPVRSKKKGRRR